MNRYLIASTREGSGKTSLILGIAGAHKKNYGYLKPFGDRLIYQRKKNWDYDSNLVIRLWGLDVEPDRITLGFNHSKLRFVYDEESLKQVINEMIKSASQGVDSLFIEGGKDICYGASISLDSLTLARYAGAKIIIVTSGDSDMIMDDIRFITRYYNSPEIKLHGVIINKVRDVDDFRESFLSNITGMGVNVMGIVPYEEKLTYYSMHYLADSIFAKVIGGEKGLGNLVKNIFVGAMSVEESLRNPVFSREDKLIITSGDRNDMVLASLKEGTAGIVLTNNIIPHSNIIAKASELNIPLLLVTHDTYQVAKQVDRLEALITPDDTGKLAILERLAAENIKI
ncbi:MAG TPA: DRTGG domain-containing protein [Spirochaetota bacterium]|mgnify:CR=1 FL=1|nr:DRTGG domain-containing protein [Spirochaetota bacterium]HPI89511.1 DRTGG domain-containing protein [Spirochaetota bacterium]HPR47099.1 DRTGG domain-containing protein [Spirochaetota bacterium]